MASPWSLEGKVALVTGSTRGIGWETARTLAAHGARLAVNGCSNAELVAERAAALSREFGVETEGLFGDAANPEHVKGFYATIYKRFRRLDVLVNNAGVLEDCLLGMVTPQVIERVFHVNVQGVILHMQYASRLMQRGTGGSIINIASIIGRVGNAGQVVYGASKAAVIGATLSAAKELAPQQVRVNAIAPGVIDTDMVRALPPDKLRERLGGVGMGRIGTTTDVSHAVLFLASDVSAYVTGQVIGVDGGMLV